MPMVKSRRYLGNKHAGPRLLVQLDTLTESHPHPIRLEGMVTLSVEPYLAVLSYVAVNITNPRIFLNVGIGCRWGLFFLSFI